MAFWGEFGNYTLYTKQIVFLALCVLKRIKNGNEVN